MIKNFLYRIKNRYMRWKYHIADMKELAIKFGMSPYRYWWINFKLWLKWSKNKTIWRIKRATKKLILKKYKES